MYYGDVANRPLAEAFLASGLSASEVCRRLGWVDKRNYAETSRLKRRLGLMMGMKGGTNKSKQLVYWTGMRYETAVAITRALNLDPVDFGL